MNIVIISGNLTKDPESRTTSTGKSMCTFTLGVRRKFKDQSGRYASDFLNVVCWQMTANFAQQYLRKGSKCTVIGSVQSRSYEAKDGTKRYVTEIIAENLEFGGKQEAAGREYEDDGQVYESRAYGAAPEPTTFSPKTQSQQHMDFFQQEDEEDKLPF